MGKVTYQAPKDAQPWERMTGESHPAYLAFSHYRELATRDRSLSRVSSDLGKDSTMVRRWSSSWGWLDRAAKWDQHLERAKMRLAVIEAEKAGVRQITHIQLLARVLVAPAEELLRRISQNELDLTQSTAEELFSMVTAAARAYPALAKLERLVRGQPTDIIDQPLDADGRPKVDEDWLREFHGAMEAIGVEPVQLALEPGEVDVVDKPPGGV